MALPTLLMPGMDGTGDLFAPLLDAMAADYEPRVLRYSTEVFRDYAALEAITELPNDDFVVIAESFSEPVQESKTGRRGPKRLWVSRAAMRGGPERSRCATSFVAAGCLLRFGFAEHAAFAGERRFAAP